jgi:glycosyltransferase involved in cell wall biosynthesis
MGKTRISRQAIVYFGNTWSSDNRTSSHHIARQLATRYQVHYIECPGLRSPQSSGHDLRRIWKKCWRFVRGPRQVPEGLKVWTLLQLPFHRFALVRWFNRLFMRTVLRWMMWREGIQQPIAWFMIPHLTTVVGQLGERLSVYYCIDDYATLPGVNQEAIRAMDEELTRKADLVFVSAESLLHRKLPLNANTYFSPHGVDVDLFARAQDEKLPVPSDTAHLPHPIVGFFGLVERWVDLDLVAYLARQRPQWTFLFIGRLAVPPLEIPQCPNLHFIGARPYEALPAYTKQFDVALIPFRLTDVILHANPLKLREYLAAGKPVVSVSTPEIERYADIVEIAHSPEEFLAKLDAVLTRPNSPAAIQQRMDRVAGESWAARIDQVIEIVNQQSATAVDHADLVPATRL